MPHFPESNPESNTVSELLSQGERELVVGNLDTAARLLSEAAALVPEDLSIAQLAANSWLSIGKRFQARIVLSQSLTPQGLSKLTDAQAYDLGARCLDAGAPELALQCFAITAKTRPDNPALLGAMASAQRSIGNLNEALRLAESAAGKDKKNGVLLLTAAQVRHARGEYAEAMTWLKRAEAVRPFHAPTRMQRALTRLIQGVSRAGWEDFENRGLPKLSHGTDATRWWQGEQLAGRSIRVVMEQGIGDLFHFLRFVPLLFERGAREVVVEAPNSALSILKSSGFNAVLPGDGPVTELATPILSLPYRLNTDRDTLGQSVPYLRAFEAEPERHAGFKDSPKRDIRNASEEEPIRAGLIATGNPDFLATNLRDLSRDAIAALLSTPGVRWTWLQPDLPPVTDDRLTVPSLGSNWLDTARTMTQLDCVVSVDTGGAHLAGALGVPLILLLPYTPDWRWGNSGTTTSWYPTATIFRELKPNSWSEVVQRVQEALSDGRNTRPSR